MTKRIKKSLNTTPFETTVEKLGARGDGIAEKGGKRYFIPATLPGERVRIRPVSPRGDGIACKLLEVLEPSPNRIAPLCRHFGPCGGCTLQHGSDEAVAALKRALIVEALSRKGFDGEVVSEEILTSPPVSRRRIRFAAVVTTNGTTIGFHERESHRIVDVKECHVAVPQIVAAKELLAKGLKQSLPVGSKLDIQITQTSSGLDVVLVPANGELRLTLDQRQDLVALAENGDFARLAIEHDGFSEPLAARRTPHIAFAGITVELPPGSFLQPTREGEAAMSALVCRHLEGCTNVADYFSGCGTFSIPLAVKNGANVHAVEMDPAAISALRKAAAGLKLTAETGDLMDAPPSPEVVSRYDGVVFDPPRAGAVALCEALAQSSVGKIAAISCNPATLARDLRILVDGGYILETVVPVDQFRWSSHVEAVALLHRPEPG